MKLGYQCGLARMFEDQETEELYEMRWMECNWNKTWTPVEHLDPCRSAPATSPPRWVQCIHPPQPPPGTHMESNYDGVTITHPSHTSSILFSFSFPPTPSLMRCAGACGVP